MNRDKKYRVIKEFPNTYCEYKVGQIISKAGYAGLVDIADKWPEYFEEVKENKFEEYERQYTLISKISLFGHHTSSKHINDWSFCVKMDFLKYICIQENIQLNVLFYFLYNHKAILKDYAACSSVKILEQLIPKQFLDSIYE